MNNFKKDFNRILNNDMTDDEKTLYYYEAWTNEENSDKKIKILKKIENFLLKDNDGKDSISK